MHCDQCGKENNETSKFCRYCGNPLLDGTTFKNKKLSHHITWRKQTTLALVGAALFGCFIFGSLKAFAYFQVRSKINSAEKLQSTGDYQGSIDLLNTWENKAVTNSQKNKVESIKADDKKFIKDKTSFDSAVSIENANPTPSSDDLQNVITTLQSIDNNYPDFKNVQSEITKVQSELVTSLKNESDASKKEADEATAQAERNKQAAAAAQVAQAQAEASAQKAQNDAASATAKTAMQSFVNQLRNIYNNFETNCLTVATSAIENYSAGQDYSIYLGAAVSACASAQADAKNLNNSFTNMPSDYADAASSMQWAAYYISQSLSDFSVQNFSQASNDAGRSSSYDNQVKNFLQTH